MVDRYERERMTVVRSKFLLVEGVLQNQDGVVHVKAQRVEMLRAGDGAGGTTNGDTDCPTPASKLAGDPGFESE